MDLLAYAITVFATLFVIVDPIGLLPVLVGLTESLTPKERASVINKAVLVACIVMALFAVAGKWILQYLGISLDAFMIAGGILLFLIAIDMLFARPSRARETEQEEEEGKKRLEEIFVFPLAIPMLAGPGTIATVMLLESMSAAEPAKLAVYAGASVLTMLTVWLVLRGGSVIYRKIGRTGTMVTSRLMGILLAALAVQFVVNGIRHIFSI